MKHHIILIVAILLLLFSLSGLSEAVDTTSWTYYTFEGSGVTMKIPPGFEDVGESVPGIFYNAGNADVLLQVIPAEGDFADRDQLIAYYDTVDYVLSAESVEINSVELVHAKGGDDGAEIYAAISAEGTTYQFVFIPQDDAGVAAIDAIVKTICPSDDIPGQTHTVEPNPWQIDLKNPEDGIYPAAFKPTDLKDGALTFDLSTEDTYDIVDIGTLQVGDWIVVDGRYIQIATLEKEETAFININGGSQSPEGVVLCAYEEDNCFKVLGDDDYHTYTTHGSVTLPLSDAVTFSDTWNIDADPVSREGLEAVTKAIAETDNDSFNEYNATVRVEGGKIVEINRYYTP